MERTHSGGIELTPRQREVLQLVERGHTNGEIAQRLGISLQGAKWHVRELLAKYGVDSREDLIEAHASSRSLKARIARPLAVLGGFALPKVSAPVLLGGAGVVLTAGAVVAVALAARGDAAEPPAAGATPAAVSFVPADGDLVLPATDGAVWTPREALDHARQSGGSALVGARTASGGAVDLDEFRVTKLEWLPGARGYEVPGGDIYWASEDGQPRNLWAVTWEAAGNGGAVGGAVNLLIEDGVATGKTVAIRFGEGGTSIGWSQGFRTRSQEAFARAMREPDGPQYRVAWLNGEPGGDYLSVVKSKAGWWCQLLAGGSQFCAGGTAALEVILPVQFSVMSSLDTARGVSRTWLVVRAQPQVERIRVLPGDGRVLDYALSAPPPELPSSTRWGYLEIGPSIPPDAITVIGYDSAGAEAGRSAGPGQQAPPALGAPGPP